MKVVVLVTVASCLQAAVAHTIFSSPQPRENSVHVNNDLNECGAQTDIAATYTRGQTVPLAWGRNNHMGGFVQVSVLPLAQVTGNGQAQVAAFDAPENIVYMTCYNRGCMAPNPDNLGYGGDGVGFQELMCRSQMTIPSYLPDGDYVMKTIAYGNTDSFGVKALTHTSYSNCHNFRVQGGAAVTTKPANGGNIVWDLRDDVITHVNQRLGTNISPTGQCVFAGTATHLGCKGRNGNNAPLCTGAIADLARCGNGIADPRATCLGNDNNDSTQGGDLHNLMVGIPPFHPQFSGNFHLLSRTNTVKAVTLPGSTPGGNTGIVATSTPTASPSTVGGGGEGEGEGEGTGGGTGGPGTPPANDSPSSSSNDTGSQSSSDFPKEYLIGGAAVAGVGLIGFFAYQRGQKSSRRQPSNQVANML